MSVQAVLERLDLAARRASYRGEAAFLVRWPARLWRWAVRRGSYTTALERFTAAVFAMDEHVMTQLGDAERQWIMALIDRVIDNAERFIMARYAGRSTERSRHLVEMIYKLRLGYESVGQGTPPEWMHLQAEMRGDASRRGPRQNRRPR